MPARLSLGLPLAAGLGAALLLTPGVPGLGWAITAALVGLSLWLGPAGLWPKLLAALAVVLVAAGVVRSAGWLFAACVGGALVLLAQAAFGEPGGPGKLRPGHPVWRLREPEEEPEHHEADGGLSPGQRLAVGLICAVVSLVVFGYLLAAADAGFAEMLSGSGVHVLVFVVVAPLAWLAQRLAGVRGEPVARERPRRWRVVEWAPALIGLDLLFGLFVLFQVRFWFAGDRVVLTPSGPTYAEYAKDGFGLLVVVTVLVLGMLTGMRGRVVGDTREKDLLWRGLAGALCAFTLVVVASALWRMDLYASVFGYTRGRVAGQALEAWLGVMVLLLLVTVLIRNAAWLRWAAPVSAALVLLGLVAVDPERTVARTVIARYEREHTHLDGVYLRGLSADAVPELDRLLEPLRTCTLLSIAKQLDRPDAWNDHNAARARAREILRERPLRTSVVDECASYLGEARFGAGSVRADEKLRLGAAGR